MPGGNQSRKREQAVEALLVSPTVKAAAARAKISYRTLRGWMTDPAFVTQYRAARRQLVEGSIGRLQRASSTAVKTLLKACKCGNHSIETKAAVAVLDFALRGLEISDLIAEVEELRRLVTEGRNETGPSGT